MNLQRRDPALADIIDYLEFGQLPLDGKDPKTKLHIIEQHYLDPDCLLYHILIPNGRRVPTPQSK